MSASVEALRGALVAAFRAALAALDPSALVEAKLPPRPPRGARVRVIAAGKAAVPMALGALRRWPEAIDDVLAVTVDGAMVALDPRVTTLAAGHPLPDARSVAASSEALRRASELGERDVLVALVSGGCSALLSLPPEGVDLDEKRALVAEMLDQGAPITAVNLVRRHFSRVKGGRLVAAASRARVLSLLLSDVIGGAAHDIGSGPSVFDPTSRAEAQAALRTWAPRHAARVAPRLSESVKPELGLRARWHVLAGPDELAAAVARELERSGVRARCLAAEQGDAAIVAARRVEQARELSPGEALVIPCEPTVTLPASRGRGGRAGLVALLAMSHLPPDVALLCAASDGVDGSSGAAGAAVTLESAERATSRAIEAALAGYADGALHASIGTAIPGGPTGTNLTDVHVIARRSR